jgi:hypothetical protein
MVRINPWLQISVLFLLTVAASHAQQSQNNQVVPTLVNFSGKLTDINGRPLVGTVGVTFYLYKDSQDQTPLWMESQNVQCDNHGVYSVALGSTKSEGLPTDVFVSGEARWLGVKIENQDEQPRILLLSVPYALKAADAQTVGGLPPSAFVLANPADGTTNHSSGPAAIALPPSGAVTGAGTVNFVPLWDSTSDITSSVIFQSGTGSSAKIGIDTTTPAATLDVKGTSIVRGLLTLPATGAATASTSFNSQPLNLAASVFNSGTGTAAPQNFRLLAEPVGNDTTSASGTLNLEFASGSNSFAETGLKIANNGQITFAPGQTFPGAGSGTVTSVGSGAGLTGGPITSSGTLSIANTAVTNGMLQNSSLTITPGTDLTGGGLTSLGGATTLNLDTTKVPQLTTANAFTGSQAVNGSVSVTGQLISTAAQGTAPLQVTSSTQVANLNASLLGGAPPGSFANLGSNNFNGNQNVMGTITTTGNIYGPTIGTNSLSSYGNTGSSFTAISASPAVSVTSYFASGDGIDINVTGSGKIFGVNGTSSSSSMGAGVYGVEGSQSGTGANNIGGAGVWGDAGNHGNEGVLATGDDTHGVLALSNGALATIYAQNNTNQAQGSSVFAAVGNYGDCTIDVSGDLLCTGSISPIVPVDGGSRRVALYAVESSESWFENVGSGQLVNGIALVTIEPTFAQTVNTAIEYHVFLTPKGDCEGFYVTNETPTGFEVHEMHGGHANVAFDYRIMARRRGYETIRLADVTNNSPNPGSVAVK